MSKPKRRRQRVRRPIDVLLPSNEYQPSKAEMEAETDMPGMSDAKLRRTFFQPVRFVRDEQAT